MANYLTIALIHILVGFEVASLGFLQTVTIDDTVEGLLISGFVLYLAGVVLTVLMKAGDLASNMFVFVSTIILVFVSAALLVAGAAIWYNPTTSSEYTMTLTLTGAILAALGGVFLIVRLIAGSPTSPGGV